MYQIKNLNFNYKNGKLIFKDTSLFLAKDKITGLSGKNGSGKTTFCRLLCGLLSGYEGKISIEGKNLQNLITAEISQSITYIKQEPLANIVAATPSEDLAIWFHRFSLKDPNQNELIESALTEYRIAELKEKPVWELSSGEIKRINLAALLLNSHKYWIIDEPLAGLDRNLQNIFLQILSRKPGSGALIISHDQTNLRPFLDHIYHIENYRIEKMR